MSLRLFRAVATACGLATTVLSAGETARSLRVGAAPFGQRRCAPDPSRGGLGHAIDRRRSGGFQSPGNKVCVQVLLIIYALYFYNVLILLKYHLDFLQ